MCIQLKYSETCFVCLQWSQLGALEVFWVSSSSPKARMVWRTLVFCTDAPQSLFRCRSRSRSFCEGRKKFLLIYKSALHSWYLLWAGNVKYTLPRILSGSFLEWLSPKDSDNLLSVHLPRCTITSFSPVWSSFLPLAGHPVLTYSISYSAASQSTAV